MRVRNIGIAALGASLLAVAAVAPAQAFGPEDYLGSVGLFAGNFCPAGTLDADGRLVSIAENDVLFNLYGTTYGGDGETTFALPDMRGKAPVPVGLEGTDYGLRYCVMISGIYPAQN